MKSISYQILASILITVIIISGGWGYVEIQNRKSDEIDFLNESKTRTANRLALNLSYPIWNLNAAEVRKLIEIESHDKKEILCIQVFDENDSLYSGIYRDPETETLHYLTPNLYKEKRKLLAENKDFVSRPILKNGRNIGAVIVYPNQKPLDHLIDILSIELIVKMLSLSLVLAGILFLVMRKVVIKPLIHLRNWAAAVTLEKSLPKIRSFKSSEMESLHRSYSDMANRLIASFDEISNKNRLLELSEARIKSISNNFTSGMIYQVITRIDGYRKFTYLSDSVQNLYGITPDEGMADPSLIYSRIHPDDVQHLIDAEIEAMKELKTFKMETRMLSISGTYRWSSFVSTPIPLEDGSIRWDGIEFDITELKETEEELRISQQKLEVAFNSSPDAILITDQETGTIIETNDALMNIFKYSREEAIGQTTLGLGLFKNPEDRQKMYQTMKEKGSIHNMEMAGKNKFGEELTVLLSVGKTIIDGKPTFISNVHDITERKKIEEELRESQEKFAIAFNSSPDAIVISEMETGIIIETNDAIKNIFGYSREEVIGKSGLELNMYKDPADRLSDFEVFHKYGHIRNLEITRRHRSGSDVIILLSLELSNINGKQCFIATLHDITERKKNELELENLNRDKDRFMSILGHDLRSPFNAIVSILDLLSADFSNMSPEESEEMLHMAQRSAHNASELLDDVLLWATAQSGKMPFTPQLIDCKENFEHIIEIFHSTANTKNIKLSVNILEGLKANADINMLNTILRNLVSNALKFTLNGGEIIISGQNKDGETIISIADNGVGIPPEDLDKIFSKAQLFTSAGTANEKGTGLGLKICQDFVEKHGGRIWVESQVNQGTTFSFSLPV